MNIADFTSQAVRLHDRYLLEVVEPLGLCPWARRARLDGRTRQHVVLDDDGERAHAAAANAIGAWKGDAKIEVGFVIFPRLDITRQMFDRFVARTAEHQASLHEVGRAPFVMAGFHPEALADETTPERLIPFLRRTPDPCIQLVRSRVLEAVRANTPQGTSFVDAATFDFSSVRDEVPLRERIARANVARVNEMGLREVTRLLDDIRADRDRTYATLRT
jgi:hypothetical protein